MHTHRPWHRPTAHASFCPAPRTPCPTQEDLAAAIEQAKYGKQYDQSRYGCTASLQTAVRQAVPMGYAIVRWPRHLHPCLLKAKPTVQPYPCIRLCCRFVGAERKRRFAVMEAGISLAATLLPAIEPIEYTTILPSTRSPLGRTVLQVGANASAVLRGRVCRRTMLAVLPCQLHTACCHACAAFGATPRCSGTQGPAWYPVEGVPTLALLPPSAPPRPTAQRWALHHGRVDVPLPHGAAAGGAGGPRGGGAGAGPRRAVLAQPAPAAVRAADRVQDDERGCVQADIYI